MIERKELTPQEFKKRNRRSFLLAGIGALLGIAGIEKILTAAEIDDAPIPFRKGFALNEKTWRGLFSEKRENSRTAAPKPGTRARVNGDVGLEAPIDLTKWNLEYESTTAKKTLSLADLQKLPRTSSQAEFRCIEGWAMPISYEGVRFSDFLRAVDPEGLKMAYVGMETPGGDYYVGMDMESMIHPQTILADTMNGAPLGAEHGEPLRLIIPVKYGIKNLKRIGKIFLADTRPRDYWGEQGYDWYSGL